MLAARLPRLRLHRRAMAAVRHAQCRQWWVFVAVSTIVDDVAGSEARARRPAGGHRDMPGMAQPPGAASRHPVRSDRRGAAVFLRIRPMLRAELRISWAVSSQSPL